jgi:hypothetical protein
VLAIPTDSEAAPHPAWLRGFQTPSRTGRQGSGASTTRATRRRRGRCLSRATRQPHGHAHKAERGYPAGNFERRLHWHASCGDSDAHSASLSLGGRGELLSLGRQPRPSIKIVIISI